MSRILIDYTPAYEQTGGIGRYVRELVHSLAREDTASQYRLFVAGAARSNLPLPPGDNFIWAPTRLKPVWLARLWHRARIPLPIETFTGPVDLVHATDFTLPPVGQDTQTLLTVHDLSFMRVPDAAAPALRRYLNTVAPRSVDRATHILADSEATKQDLIDLYNLAPDKITVLLSGVDPHFKPVNDSATFELVRQKYAIGPRPYIFTIGTVQPRKNYSRLIEALSVIRSGGDDVDLVIAGGKGWLEDEMYHALDVHRLRDHVHLIGFADDADLPALYSAADCVAFPSLYEGFGFPVLEGMACGVPVLTSNVSSLPEVAGDAALMVDPYDVEAIVDGLRRMLDDSALREDMVTAGFTQAARFTWDASARQLHDIYQRLLAR